MIAVTLAQRKKGARRMAMLGYDRAQALTACRAWQGSWIRMAAQAKEADAARFEAVIHGVVQGVFFRYCTKKEADRLGIAGTVRNWPDGTVHVDATGPRQQLQELVDWLHDGPERAVVERVDVVWLEDEVAREGFRIVG